ncbi:ROK family protein [Tamlana sp. 2201CG12-4]|uniref:ROK family protein n=1 Tax=Tamlana sp. 2201CG12-4 TaxID=3112582 RepID=UPI002DB587F0|nr:ROK family protein [Tamlana sp. 2201CG12-4]MEC3907045.1 ROK family protein [Tamlana sp. 2201CG12-4]
MKSKVAIGVDIGGSHITSAAVDISTLEIIPETTYSVKVNNKAAKEAILLNWSEAINKTLEHVSKEADVNIGFAIPGPFHYKTGLAKFEGNDKYENLYNASIPDELTKYIDAASVNMRFINDATAFGVGVSAMGKAKSYSKTVVVTLGTGFGSAFIKDGVPLVNSEDVPEGGCLWDKPFKDGIADDYFSTRWCIKRYFEVSSKQVHGVKEIAEANDAYSKQVFTEFGSNMAEFMIPFLQKFKQEIIVLGGNVSLAHEFFLPTLKQKINEAGLLVDFEISTLMEDAAIIGSAKLFVSDFWEHVKNDLPNL